MKITSLVAGYLAGVLVLACTHTDALRQKPKLTDAYQDYALLLENHKAQDLEYAEQILKRYTQEKQHALINAQIKTPQFLQELISNYLSFPQWMTKEFNTVEVRTGQQGCLLVNGFTEDLEPMSIMLSYEYDQQWLINDVAIEYLQPPQKFLDRPVCDPQQLAAIRSRQVL